MSWGHGVGCPAAYGDGATSFAGAGWGWPGGLLYDTFQVWHSAAQRGHGEGW